MNSTNYNKCNDYSSSYLIGHYSSGIVNQLNRFKPLDDFIKFT